MSVLVSTLLSVLRGGQGRRRNRRRASVLSTLRVIPQDCSWPSPAACLLVDRRRHHVETHKCFRAEGLLPFDRPQNCPHSRADTRDTCWLCLARGLSHVYTVRISTYLEYLRRYTFAHPAWQGQKHGCTGGYGTSDGRRAGVRATAEPHVPPPPQERRALGAVRASDGGGALGIGGRVGGQKAQQLEGQSLGDAVAASL